MSNITIYIIYFLILKFKPIIVLLVFAVWAWVMFNILIPMSGVNLFERTEYWKNYKESYYKESLNNKVCNVKIINNKCCKNNKEKTNPK